MPAVSKKQQRFAGMSMTPKGRRELRKHGKKPMPVEAARHFAKQLSTTFSKGNS